MQRTNRFRTLVPLFIILFAIILVGAIIFLFYSLRGNYLTESYVDNSADRATTILAKDSNAIIINGVLLGASKDGKWISAKRFYDANGGAGKLEVNLYSLEGALGTYSTASFKQNRDGLIYTMIAKETLPNQYLAVSSNIPKAYSKLKKQDATKEDEEHVKEALGGYLLLNGSIKINEVYSTNIADNNDRIICVTAEKANWIGVYSAVIYVSNNTARLIKYSHVKDVTNSDRWPVYSAKFVQDLNGDNMPELILEEVTGSDVRYTVHEFRNNKFYQVLTISVAL